MALRNLIELCVVADFSAIGLGITRITRAGGKGFKSEILLNIAPTGSLPK